MSTRFFRNISIISLTFFLGLVLAIWPLPNWAVYFRPEWLVLVTLYWAIALPHRVNIGVAWFLGLLLDVLYGTVLGEHALALALVVYCAIKVHRQVRVFPLWQQALIVMLLLMVYQLIMLLVQAMLGETIKNNSWFWVPAMTSALLWPWVFILLRDCRRRCNID